LTNLSTSAVFWHIFSV